jgi:fermentation-respiration switch protein FrsA (DUF1100 family)
MYAKYATHAVRFDVRGDTVVGDLHWPTGERPCAAVIVAGPMTSVKEQVTGVYAAALARHGLAALAIDHRHYGESGGQPRQLEHHGHKLEDLLAAVDWLANCPGIDPARLGAVGVCLGAGYAAAAAAAEPRLRAFVGIAGYYRDPIEMRRCNPDDFDAKVAQGRAARAHYEATGEVLTIPAAALQGDAAMQTTDTVDYYTRRAAVPNHRNAFALMSREHFLPFNVMALAPAVRQPSLLLHSAQALSPLWAERFFDALPGPKEIQWLTSRGQTDFYDDPALVSNAAERAARHLLRSLQ